MNLQYISDSHGKTTGVFIPIAEWNALKEKYKGIGTEEISIPVHQITEVRERIEAYKNNPDQIQDLNDALRDIEKDL